MRYSLLSRFQGALLGAVLGDEIGSYRQNLTLAEEPAANLYRWRPGLGHDNQTDLNPSFLSWKGKEVINWSNALLRYGSLNTLAKHLPTSQAARSELFPANRTAAEMAIATLPLTLFCHDSDIKLRQSLELIIAPSQEEPLGQLFVFGYVMAQLLQEQWNPLTLIPQTIHKLKQTDLRLTVQQALTAWLERVQQCLQQRMSLQQAIATLHPSGSETQPEFSAIALAFYCFLSTPDDFALALFRAAQTDDQPATVTALTGTLVGAHNSIIDIPLEWHLALADPNQSRFWGISGLEIQALATHLLTSWSGVYDAANDFSKIPPIAAPGVIRPR